MSLEENEKEAKFELVSREAKVILSDCVCTECKEGFMIRTGRKFPGKVDKTKVFFQHVCNKCKFTQNFANVIFPKVEFMPVDEYEKMVKKQKEESEKKDKNDIKLVDKDKK